MYLTIVYVKVNKKLCMYLYTWSMTCKYLTIMERKLHNNFKIIAEEYL